MADVEFEFEDELDPPQAGPAPGQGAGQPPMVPPGANIGQQLGNFKKNFRQTVCTYWLRGLCMKGETCGFLHQYDVERMPTCRALLKYGVCKEPDCPYKHTMDDIKECNMYKLGFCIYGPMCRYKHTRLTTPPPDPAGVEACKPKEFRNINLVVNTANEGIAKERERLEGRAGGFGAGGRGFGRRFEGKPPGNGQPSAPGSQMTTYQPRPPPGRPPAGPPPREGNALLASVGQQGFPYGF